MSLVAGPFCGVARTTTCLALPSVVTIMRSSSAVRAQALSSLVNRSNLLPPMSIDTSHLPARRFPGLRKQLERHRSLYETLRSAYGIQLAEAEETIETVLADPHDAQLLEVDAGLPLLLLSRHAYDVTGEPVEWAQSWYRGDRYKFVTRLRR